ncbi:GNAT family N-acetyltransferase, partial [Actinoplanes sp. NPDC049596]
GLGALVLDRGLAEVRALAAPPRRGALAAHLAPGAAAEGGSPSAAGSDVAADGERVVNVEAESLTDDAAALFDTRGLRQDFAEDVMWADLAGEPPAAVWPEGAAMVSWSGEVARRFHAVYDASFRDRPGFPGYRADDWIDENEEDEDFRPDCSLLVSLPGVGDAGFVTAARDWIIQVGVVPSARRRGLAAALVSEALARLQADGSDHAWLTVNVNNPGAAAVYRGLGFRNRGRRARYRPAP